MMVWYTSPMDGTYVPFPSLYAVHYNKGSTMVVVQLLFRQHVVYEASDST